jgi:hypothetical protein
MNPALREKNSSAFATGDAKREAATKKMIINLSKRMLLSGKCFLTVKIIEHFLCHIRRTSDE